MFAVGVIVGTRLPERSPQRWRSGLGDRDCGRDGQGDRAVQVAAR